MKIQISAVAFLLMLVFGCKTAGTSSSSVSAAKIKEGNYRIVSTETAGWCVGVDPSFAADADGPAQIAALAQNQDQNQTWHIAPNPAWPGAYTIAAEIKGTGYLQPENTSHETIGANGDITARFREIHWYPASHNAFQAWTFEPVAGGSAFRIRNLGSGFVMEGESRESKSLLQASTSIYDGQIWLLQPVPAETAR